MKLTEGPHNTRKSRVCRSSSSQSFWSTEGGWSRLGRGRGTRLRSRGDAHHGRVCQGTEKPSPTNRSAPRPPAHLRNAGQGPRRTTPSERPASRGWPRRRPVSYPRRSAAGARFSPPGAARTGSKARPDRCGSAPRGSKFLLPVDKQHVSPNFSS